MHAFLRSVRIAPKKANLSASMIRGLPAQEALAALQRTPKKGARILEKLLQSAVANAEHNDNQRSENLLVKTVVVNQGQAYRRGVPMARGRVRPIRKFLSHISITLGVLDDTGESKPSTPQKAAAKKPAKTPSQAARKPAQSNRKKSEKGTPAGGRKAKTGTAASDSASQRTAAPAPSGSTPSK